MKKIYILALVLLSLTLLGCGGNHNAKKSSIDNDIMEYHNQLEDIKNLNISIEYLPLKHTALNISVSIANNTDHDILLLHEIKSPLYFSVIEDGVKINHIDANIDFLEGGEIMKPGTFQFYNIDIATWFYTHKGTHRYEITLEPINGWKSNTIEFDAKLTKDGGKPE